MLFAKVNQLVAFCDELYAKLRQAEADSEERMNGAVQHALCFSGRQLMKRQNGAKDQDTGATLRALRRAARRARELGAKTGTPVYVIEGQRIVDLTKQDAHISQVSLKREKPYGR